MTRSIFKKWMGAVETKDEKVKTDFKCGLETLVKNSAEDNGVWKMMVAASSLHEQQQHNLDLLQKENNELKFAVRGKEDELTRVELELELGRWTQGHHKERVAGGGGAAPDGAPGGVRGQLPPGCGADGAKKAGE